MSCTIYIPLLTVLSHPGQFKLQAALNGCIANAQAEITDPDPDWDYIQEELRPLLLCKFGARDTWRVVDIIKSGHHYTVPEELELRVTCGGNFVNWLIRWLEDNNYEYTII